MASTTKRKPPPRRPAAPVEDPDTDEGTDVGDFEEVQQRVAARPSSQSARAVAARKAATTATTGLTPQKLVAQLSDARLSLQQGIDELGQRILAEERVLSDLNTAVKVRTEELEELYGKETAAASLAQLVADHQHKTQALEAEYETKRRELEQEQEQAEAEFAQQTENKKRERAKEEADYRFITEQRRREADERWAELERQRAREVEQQTYQRDRGWAQREEALQAREAELVQLREGATAAEARTKAEVDKAVAIATNSLKKDLDAKAALAAAEARTQLALLEQANKSLVLQNAAVLEQNKQLEARLEAAQSRVQEIAKAAMSEAGSAKALSEITSFAQRENSSPSRKS